MPDEGCTGLAGDRVVPRRFRPDEVAEFVAYRPAAQVARFQSWDTSYPRAEGERFIAEMMARHPDTAGPPGWLLEPGGATSYRGGSCGTCRGGEWSRRLRPRS